MLSFYTKSLLGKKYFGYIQYIGKISACSFGNFQELEQKLSLQEHDAIIVKNMKNELAQFPKMERELQQLREENAYLRLVKEKFWHFVAE